MPIQIIKIQPIIFRVKETDYEFVKPKYLMPANDFKVIEAKVKGSTMVWNIEGETISYNQVKSMLSS